MVLHTLQFDYYFISTAELKNTVQANKNDHRFKSHAHIINLYEADECAHLQRWDLTCFSASVVNHTMNTAVVTVCSNSTH